MLKRVFLGLSFLVLGTFGLSAQTTGTYDSQPGTTQSDSQPGTTQQDQNVGTQQSGTQSGTMKDERELGRSDFDANTNTQRSTSSSSTTTQTETDRNIQGQSQYDESGQQLPRTASSLPLVALFGLMLVAASFMMRGVRSLKNNR